MASCEDFLFVLLVCCACFGPIHNWEPCEDWIPYNDEKCFKVIDDTLRTFDEAKEVCASQEQVSTLALIRSSEEQQFLSNYLFKTERKVENFWIGAQYSSQNGSFVWIDNSPLNYTNWDAGHSPQSRENHCVNMQADYRVAGKWKDGSCDKKNAVVCQMMQFWTIDFLQKTLVDLRRQQTDNIRVLTQSLESANQKINEVSKELDHTKQNPVPIGFIYVQLSGQPEPSTLWSTVQWQDVTSHYAGLFFRAEGGDSAQFGTVQEDNAPRVTNARYQSFETGQGSKYASTKFNVGNWTSGVGVFSGAWSNQNYRFVSLQFLQSDGEVRPRNMAMRVWKRIS